MMAGEFGGDIALPSANWRHAILWG